MIMNQLIKHTAFPPYFSCIPSKHAYRTHPLHRLAKLREELSRTQHLLHNPVGDAVTQQRRIGLKKPLLLQQDGEIMIIERYRAARVHIHGRRVVR